MGDFLTDKTTANCVFHLRPEYIKQLTNTQNHIDRQREVHAEEASPQGRGRGRAREGRGEAKRAGGEGGVFVVVYTGSCNPAIS